MNGRYLITTSSGSGLHSIRTSINGHNLVIFAKLTRKDDNDQKPFKFPPHRILPGNFIKDGRFHQASTRRPFMPNWAEWMFYDVDKGCLRAWTGAIRGGVGWGHTLSLGSAPLKGSRRLGPWAKLLGSSGKADLGQEEPGRGTNDSLSHILQGKNPAVCVAFRAGCYCSLGSFLSQNKSTWPVNTCTA